MSIGFSWNFKENQKNGSFWDFGKSFDPLKTDFGC